MPQANRNQTSTVLIDNAGLPMYQRDTVITSMVVTSRLVTWGAKRVTAAATSADALANSK